MRILSTYDPLIVLPLAATTSSQAQSRPASRSRTATHAASDPTAELELKLSALQGLWLSRRIRAAFLEQSRADS